MLQKAPQFLQFEPRITEKFIRKHIGDYSGYHHRQHVLKQMLTTGWHEDRQKLHIEDYQSLCDYVDVVCGQMWPDDRPHTIDLLLSLVLLDDGVAYDNGAHRLITLLYCLNSAAYDLRMCDELTDMFGKREAFECHRRWALQFIVEHSTAGPVGSPVRESPPLPKLARRMEPSDTDDSNDSGSTKAERGRVDRRLDDASFMVMGMVTAEGLRGDKHRQWCTLFLGFDYSECPDGMKQESSEQMDGAIKTEAP